MVDAREPGVYRSGPAWANSWDVELAAVGVLLCF